MMTGTCIPDVVFFYAPGCVFCPQVHRVLDNLWQQGKLQSLEAINIADDATKANELGVRSVPWCRIGDIVLQGQHSEQEIRDWVALVAQGKANEEFLLQSLENGRLADAEALLQRRPDVIDILLKVLPDLSQSINVRVGISALLEGLQGTASLVSQIPALGNLLQNGNPQVRADACHYLGLTQHPAARDYLQAALLDENAEVREIAQEGLDVIT